MEEVGEGTKASVDLLRLRLTLGAKKFEVELAPDATTDDLTRLVEETQGVLQRFQKLIFKGKTLTVSGKTGATTLSSWGIRDKAAIMVIPTAAEANKVSTAGQRVASSVAASRAKATEAKRRLEATAACPGGPGASPADHGDLLEKRIRGWEATGVVALRAMELTTVPDCVLDMTPMLRIRSLDLSRNSLVSLPCSLPTAMPTLERLNLADNQLKASSSLDTVLQKWSDLRILFLQGNQLDRVPSALRTLTKLKILQLGHNQISQGVECLGSCEALQQLSLTGNRLDMLPPELGKCVALEDLRAAENLIGPSVPEELSRLKQLRTLVLDKNRIRTFPSAVLRDCSNLQTLTVHSNPLTMEQLRETPGYENHDKRRIAKHDKNIDFSVMLSEFDEGADIEHFNHYAKQ